MIESVGRVMLVDIQCLCTGDLRLGVKYMGMERCGVFCCRVMKLPKERRATGLHQGNYYSHRILSIDLEEYCSKSIHFSPHYFKC